MTVHHPVPEQRCPVCDDRITCHAGVNTTEPPRAGDVSVCAYCGTILQFGADLKVEICSAVELEQCKADAPDEYETLMTLQRNVRELAGSRRRMNFGRN